MILYKNMKVMLCSPDGDTNLFNIVTGVLQGDTFAPYLFMICQDCKYQYLQISIDLRKENNFTLKKQESS